ncbi:hypothetical protein L5F32_03790 [Aliarcobacter butzleri]|uniref:hypothetical protein n=1 Tax=Aliarcobacter butzleri TaxID=28197 RepID=UPI001EDC7C0B|nr:hypothetical protein [Aliarcobacter butzleri]MCG3651390.1 hypothetical protein [Aliarcobacter butzleri]
MKKLLIIEDKTDRQRNFVSSEKLDIFNKILKNAIDKDCATILEQFEKDNFNILEEYEYIAIHESIFKPYEEEIFEKVKKYIKDKDKKLILFSGGLFSVFLQKTQNILYLSDYTFYSNLKIFLNNLDKKIEDILMLAYGECYIINPLIEIKNSINRFLDENKTVNEFRFKSVQSKTNFNQIDKHINFSDYQEEGKITKDSLVKIVNKIEQIIKDII